MSIESVKKLIGSGSEVSVELNVDNPSAEKSLFKSKINSTFGSGYAKGSGKTLKLTSSKDIDIPKYAKIMVSAGINKTEDELEIYLSSDPQYNTFPRNKKNTYKQKMQRKLEIIALEQLPKSEAHNKDLINKRVSLILAYSGMSGKSLDEIVKMSPDILQDRMKTCFFQYNEEISAGIEGKGTAKSSETARTEKINNFADVYLSKTDSKYEQLPPEKKEQKRNEFINDILLGVFGMDINVDNMNFERFINGFDINKFKKFDTGMREFFKENGVNDIKKCKTQNYAKYCYIMNKYLESLKDLGIDQAKLKQYGAYTELMQKAGEHPTNKDILDEINKIPEKERTPEQNKIKEEIDLYIRIRKNENPESDALNEPVNIDSLGLSVAGIVSNDPLAVTDMMFSSVSNIDTKEGFAQASAVVQEIANNFVNDITDNKDDFTKKLSNAENNIRTIGRERGWSEEKIDALVQHFHTSINHVKAAAEYAVNGFSRNAAQTAADAEDCGKSGASDAIVQTGTQYINEKYGDDAEKSYQSAEFNIGLGNHDNLRDTFFEIARDIFSSDVVDEIIDRTISSSDSSDEVIESTARAYVQSGRDDNEKLSAGRYLSKNFGGNKHVLQGAATAARSIGNPEKRAVYNKNIQSALNNSSVPERAGIQRGRDSVRAASVPSANRPAAETPRTSSADFASEDARSEAERIDKFAQRLDTDNPAEAYISYLHNVTKIIEPHDTPEIQKAASEQNGEITQIRQFYNGISPKIVQELSDAYKNNDGAAGVYAKLQELKLEDVRTSFLIYFAKNADMADIRYFAMKYSDDKDVMKAVCTYGNVSALPNDVIVSCAQEGWINNNALNVVLNGRKGDLSFLRRLYNATRNPQVFYFNFDLLAEYISAGKVNLAALPLKLYQDYKASLSPDKQKELEDIYEQGKSMLAAQAEIERAENEGLTSGENVSEYETETGAEPQTAAERGSKNFYRTYDRQADVPPAVSKSSKDKIDFIN